MARVILKNVYKTYSARTKGGNDVEAVKNLNLDIKDGEFMALLGPSGCGKTSTLRMIAGLETITKGEIYFDDLKVNDLSPAERNVAMAFETYSLYPHLTVYQNIAFPLEVRRKSRAEIDKVVNSLASKFQLLDVLSELPGKLSGGQQQRVSLARALGREPSVFLLDEPLSHSDAQLRFQMRTEIKRLHYEIKATMIYVTHDQLEALSLADRVAVMNFAELQQVGTRDELYNNPYNLFIADFIGEPPMNLNKGTVIEEGDKLYMKLLGSSINLYLNEERQDKIRKLGKKEYIVGLRPQDIVPLEKPSDHKTFKAEIDYVEFIGEKSLLSIKNGEISLKVLAPPDIDADKGDVIEFSYLPNRVHIFDIETEKSILVL